MSSNEQGFPTRPSGERLPVDIIVATKEMMQPCLTYQSLVW